MTGPSGSRAESRPGDGRRWDWRYAVAGLGWGLAVGILTGVLVGLVVVLASTFSAGTGVVGQLTLLVVVPLYGALVGALIGTPVGLVAGLVTTGTVGGTLDPRRARWRAFWTTLVVGALSTPLVAAVVYRAVPPVADLVQIVALLALPVLLGAYLMSRTSGTVVAAAEERLREFGSVSG